MYALENPDFVKISDGNSSYFGGTQSWFEKKFFANGGCGVVAAANLLAYLALSEEKYKALYPKKTLEKSDFTEFMCEIGKFVRIRSFFGKPLGVWGKGRFEKGVLSYAKSRGVSLSAIPFCGRMNFKNAADYIKNALSENLPVAMLIGLNKRLKSVKYEYPNGNARFHSFERHWVTITELSEEDGRITLRVSSWGASAYIDLKDFVDGEKLYSALICFK